MHCCRLHIHLQEYTGINIILNLNGLCIFKSYVIGEKRTTPYNIVKQLKYELFILCKYFFEMSIDFITSFNDKLAQY